MKTILLLRFLELLINENIGYSQIMSEYVVEKWEILSNFLKVSPSPVDTDTESLQSP